METKISKIQFRQDTQANWNISKAVPAVGEPCYDIENKIFKIGDGVNQFKDLKTQTIPEDLTFIEEPFADNEVYGRKRASVDKVGEWVKVKPADNIKSLSDLLPLAYNTELDMGYKIKLNDDTEKEVCAIKIYKEITAQIDETVTTTIKEGVTKLISLTGTINDGTDNYIIPAKTDTFYVNAYLDKESSSVLVISKSNEVRKNAPLDLYIFYTKD